MFAPTHRALDNKEMLYGSVRQFHYFTQVAKPTRVRRQDVERIFSISVQLRLLQKAWSVSS